MSLIPVEGNKGLFRDGNSKAILNCSESDYERYLQLKSTKIKEVARLDEMTEKLNQIDQSKNEEKQEIEKIKNELSELKILMKELVSQLQSNS